ncbi:MAG: RidA family protein [Myxococcaceae bacterium]|nr:RidA family protein [Myxococcaceae bacterium]MCI0671115.1 RidA family protein [Myxococcaceae bacterium]
MTFSSFGFGMSWEQTYGYSQALRAGSLLIVSGQLSHDMQGRFIGEGDFELQVRTAYANLDRVLTHFNATKERVVGTTSYVKDLRRHFDTLARVNREYFGSHKPTSTVIGVVDLVLPQQLVEIAAIAVLT